MKTFTLTTTMAMAAAALFQGVTALPAEAEPLQTVKERSTPLPEGAANGFYTSTVHANGTIAWKYLGVARRHETNTDWIPEAPAHAAIEARRTGVKCQKISINDDDREQAVTGLIAKCGTGLSFKKKISYKYGSVVAYGCDYGKGQKCHKKELQVFFSALYAQCSGENAAKWLQPKWKSSYGYTADGIPFC